MENIIKQVAGIDVAQKELVVSLGRMDQELTLEIFAHKVFPNNQKGFNALTQWVEKLTDHGVRIRYVMEATGVYHEPFTYYLTDKYLEVSIVLPHLQLSLQSEPGNGLRSCFIGNRIHIQCSEKKLLILFGKTILTSKSLSVR